MNTFATTKTISPLSCISLTETVSTVTECHIRDQDLRNEQELTLGTTHLLVVTGEDPKKKQSIFVAAESAQRLACSGQLDRNTTIIITVVT